ncbi:MAG: SDR family oxidoreductase [Nannocystaceae bacterium]
MHARRSLQGHVALVAGATRGAGRGIAVALGELGATVWCTGRSVAGATPPGRPETIEETAAMVTDAGGEGRWRRVDHCDAAAVAALCAEIDAAHGGLDLLVNDIWGGDALTQWGVPFWEHDLDGGLRLLDLAVRTHLITSRHAVPLVLRRCEARGRGGLVVELTDGLGDHYRGSLYYDLAKASTIRLAFAMAEELRPRGVAAVAVTPGFMRSEAVLDHFGVDETRWRAAIARDPHFAASETPRYVGRGIAALAADPDKLADSGAALSSAMLAARYDLVDADGQRPDFGAYARELVTGALVDAAARGALDLACADALLASVGPLAAPFVAQVSRRLHARLRTIDAAADRSAVAAAVAATLRLG